jgi:hypothetical protein
MPHVNGIQVVFLESVLDFSKQSRANTSNVFSRSPLAALRGPWSALPLEDRRASVVLAELR